MPSTPRRYPSTSLPVSFRKRTCSGYWLLNISRARQPHLAIELTQQEDAVVGGDVAAIEAGDDLTAFAAWKGGGGRGTCCHGD
jgi:hypothetical protein